MDETNQNTSSVKSMFINFILGGSSEAEKEIKKVDNSMKAISSSARQAEQSVNSLLGILGAGYSIDYTINKFLELNRQMILSTSQFRKYGLEIEKTKVHMKGLSKELSMTQKETMEMMSAFESNMPSVSLGGMEKILKNIRQVTGSNSDAMKQYLSTFSSISNKFPEMQSMLSNLTDEQGNLNKASAKRLRDQNMLLASTGQLSLAESKAIMDQVEGLRKKTMAEESAFKKQMQAQEASQKFKQTYEELSIVVGQTILPAMTAFSKILENNSFFIKDFLTTAAKLAPIAIGTAIAFKGIGAAVKIGKTIKGSLSKGGIKDRTSGYKSVLGSAFDSIKNGNTIGYSRDNAVWVRDANGENVRDAVDNLIGQKDKKNSSLIEKAIGIAKSKNITGRIGGIIGRTTGRGAGTVVSSGGISKNILSGIKKAGPGIILAIGGIAAKWAGKKVENTGMKKTGAAIGLGGSMASIGGYALTGSAVAGPLGAVVGGIIGFVAEMGNIGESIAKISGDGVLSDTLRGLSEGIETGLSQLGTNIKSALGDATEWISDSWIGDWAKEYRKAFGDGVRELKKGFAWAGEVITDMGSAISDAAYDAIPYAKAYKEYRETKERFMQSEEKWMNMMREQLPKAQNRIKERSVNVLQDSFVADFASLRKEEPLEGDSSYTASEKEYMRRLSSGEDREKINKEMGSSILTDDEKLLIRGSIKENFEKVDFAGGKETSLGLDVEGIKKYAEESGGEISPDQIKSLVESDEFGIKAFQKSTGADDDSIIKAIQSISKSGELESVSASDVAAGGTGMFGSDFSESEKNAIALNNEIKNIIEQGAIENATKEKAIALETQMIERAQIRLKIAQSLSAAYDAQASKLSNIASMTAEFGSKAVADMGFGSVGENLQKAKESLISKRAGDQLIIKNTEPLLASIESRTEKEIREKLESQGITGTEQDMQVQSRLSDELNTNTGYQMAKSSVDTAKANLAKSYSDERDLNNAITVESERQLAVQEQITSAMAARVSETSQMLKMTGKMSDGVQVENEARSKIAQNEQESLSLGERIASEEEKIKALKKSSIVPTQAILESEAKIIQWQNKQKSLRSDNIRQLQEILEYYDAFQQSQTRVAGSVSELLDSTVELSVMTKGLVSDGEIQSLIEKDIAETRSSIASITANIAQKNAVAMDILSKQGSESVAYKNIIADINSLTAQRNQSEVKILQSYFSQSREAEKLREIQEGYLSGQEELYNSQMQYAALTGNINIDELVQQYGSVKESLLKQRELIKSSIAEQEQAIISAMNDTNASESFRLQQQQKLLELRAKELDITKRLQDSIVNIGKVYEQKSRSAQLESDYLQQMVQLQDSLTVGIGASASVRMQSFHAVAQEIAIMKEEQAALQKLLEEGNIPLEQQVQVENRLKELRNEQLKGLQKQNDLVKSLRDGWVSAITAATNGQGKITKIMVTQDGNLAALQDRFAGLRSSMSGATLRPGEISIGAMESQRFNVYGGGVPGTAGISGGTGIGYLSDVDRWLGLDPTQLSQQMLSGQREEVVDQFSKSIEKGVGSGKSLGAEGQNQQLINAPGSLDFDVSREKSSEDNLSSPTSRIREKQGFDNRTKNENIPIYIDKKEIKSNIPSKEISDSNIVVRGLEGLLPIRVKEEILPLRVIDEQLISLIRSMNSIETKSISSVEKENNIPIQNIFPKEEVNSSNVLSKSEFSDPFVERRKTTDYKSTSRNGNGIQINCTFHVNSMGEVVSVMSKKLRELQQQHSELAEANRPSGQPR